MTDLRPPAEGIGPIEALHREHVRREEVLMAADLPEEIKG